MRAVGREAWATAIVVLKDSEERWLVANIIKAGLVKIIEPRNEGARAAKQGDERSHITGNEARGRMCISSSLAEIMAKKSWAQEQREFLGQSYSQAVFPDT